MRTFLNICKYLKRKGRFNYVQLERNLYLYQLNYYPTKYEIKNNKVIIIE